MYRYYSTLRPIGPGTFPGKPDNIKNFDDRIYIKEIDHKAWGYIEYKEPITAKEAAAYDLMSERRNENVEQRNITS